MIIDYLYNNWQPLGNKKVDKLTETAIIQHKAIQLIALAGKYLISQEPDDGNISLQWIPKQNFFVGKLIQANPVICFGLDIINFDLVLFNEGIDALSVFNLINRTESEAFEWMKSQLSKFGLDKKSLGNKMNYSIKAFENKENIIYKPPEYKSTIEWAKLRTNANMLLEFISEDFEFASEIRIWPHHFDSQVFIPLNFNNRKEITKSIRIGLSITDNIINEPYFYVDHFCKKKEMNYSKLIDFSDAGKWYINGWKGAALKYTEIIKKDNIDEQVTACTVFFKEAIDSILNMINCK